MFCEEALGARTAILIADDDVALADPGPGMLPPLAGLYQDWFPVVYSAS